MYTLNLDLLKIKNVKYFFILTIFICVITFLIQYLFYSDTIFFNTYSEQLSVERIQKLSTNQKQYQWFGFLFIPIFLILKIIYNNFFITAGSLLDDKLGDFKDNYNICLKAEYVFVMMLIVKFGCFVIYKRVNTIFDLTFIPGSLANLFPISIKPQWYQYLLQTINIWEVLFCIVGTHMYSIQYNVGKTKAAKLFCIPYLTGLFIWVLIVTFISLQLT